MNHTFSPVFVSAMLSTTCSFKSCVENVYGKSDTGINMSKAIPLHPLDLLTSCTDHQSSCSGSQLVTDVPQKTMPLYIQLDSSLLHIT